MEKNGLFPAKSRVCFVGDSITHAGYFIRHIYEYYRTEQPQLKVEFYNCGIAGGNLRNTIDIYKEDIDIYEPTHIVLMIGVNDSRRHRLDNEPSDERYEKIFESYEKYQRNLEEFYGIAKERNVELILCTPAPYDEYQAADSPCFRGGYALMQGYAAYIKEFALKNGILVCDYHSAMTRAMQSDVLYSTDRVHPNDKGHLFMARTFLEFQGVDRFETSGFSSETEEWHVVTQKLRDVVTAEYFASPEYLKLSDEKRICAVREKVDMVDKGQLELGDYVEGLMRRYLENKPHQAEYISFLKNYMKN